MSMQELDANLVGKGLGFLRDGSNVRVCRGTDVACEQGAVDGSNLPPGIQPAPTLQAGSSDRGRLVPALQPK
jgi:hypothetical protein